MKILYVASEALPFASTGGLADVIGSLPKAVKKELGRGSDVRVVMPMYPSIRDKFAERLYLECETTVWLAWRNQYCGVWKTESDGVTFYFIDNLYYFDRGALYGSYDDGERFAFFSKSVMEMMSLLNFYPDILHANDWQSALTVIYLKKKYGHILEYRNIRAVFTIHNIDYQGMFDFKILGDVFELPEWERSTVEYNGCINLLKGAVTCADMVTTVSETYSREILMPYYSSGMHHILGRANSEGRLTGIVNGIDVDYYDPATDPDIAAHFSLSDMSGKTIDKADLQRTCGLREEPDFPIIAMVSRLTAHKGFDLVKSVIEDIVNYGNVQFVLLGTGERELEDYFKGLEARHPGMVCSWLEYNKSISKKFYAGADFFLMPSRSEPCGLAQMIASRYGTVPIVRACGGLADTIKPYNEYDGSGNGFTFNNYDAGDMRSVINYALSVYFDEPKRKTIVKNAMSEDFSWNVSAKKYIEIYKGLI